MNGLKYHRVEPSLQPKDTDKAEMGMAREVERERVRERNITTKPFNSPSKPGLSRSPSYCFQLPSVKGVQ